MLEALVEWVLDTVTFIIVSVIKVGAMACWVVQRAVGALTNRVVTSNLWSGGVDELLDQMTASLPDVYQNMLLGSSGLIYIGLIMSGAFMLIPQFVTKRRPVELDRLLYWSMLMIGLFVSTTAGFDLIKGLELARLSLSQRVRTSVIPSGSMAGMVGGLVEATEPEITEVSLFSMALPAVYEARYFSHTSETRQVIVEYYNVDILGVVKTRKIDVLTVDTPESRAERLGKAMDGLWVMVMNFIPTALSFVVLWLFVMLAVQALICILYFLFVLPIGMFEFGTTMLAEIAKRYMMIWILSIMLSLLPSILIGVNLAIFNSEVETVGELISGQVIYLFTLIVIIAVLFQMGKTINKMVGGTFATLGESLNAGLRPYAGTTELARPADPIRSLQAGNATLAAVAVGGATFAMTGSPQLGMMAGSMTYQAKSPDRPNPSPMQMMHVFNEGRYESNA